MLDEQNWTKCLGYGESSRVHRCDSITLVCSEEASKEIAVAKKKAAQVSGMSSVAIVLVPLQNDHVCVQITRQQRGAMP